jgi:hypothetical protein
MPLLGFGSFELDRAASARGNCRIGLHSILIIVNDIIGARESMADAYSAIAATPQWPGFTPVQKKVDSERGIM